MSSVLSLGLQVQGDRTSEKTDCVGVLLRVCFLWAPSDTIPVSSVGFFSHFSSSLKGPQPLLASPHSLVKNLIFGKTFYYL